MAFRAGGVLRSITDLWGTAVDVLSTGHGWSSTADDRTWPDTFDRIPDTSWAATGATFSYGSAPTMYIGSNAWHPGEADPAPTEWPWPVRLWLAGMREEAVLRSMHVEQTIAGRRWQATLELVSRHGRIDFVVPSCGPVPAFPWLETLVPSGD